MRNARIPASRASSPRRRQRIVLGCTLIAMGLAGYLLLTSEIGRVSSEVLRVALKPTPLETVTAFGHTGQAAPSIVEGGIVPDGTSPAEQEQDAAASLPQNAQFAAADQNGIIPLSYSLEPAFNPGEGGLRVKKQIALQGGGETELSLFLLNGTRIEIARDDLVAALTRLGTAQRAAGLPETDRMSLDQVRRAGLDLRYDAIRDRLMLVD